MSYTVKLRDDSAYSLEDSDAESLKEALAIAKKPFMAELGSDTIMSSQIVSIKKNDVSNSTGPKYEQLFSGKRCHGQYSIQREINNIAQGEGSNWAQLIRDRKWRESVRVKLWTLNNEWCDHKQETCFCE